MLIGFRVDSSEYIGTGHVMRCLTLADELRRRGAEIRFFCRELPHGIRSALQERHYTLSVLGAAATGFDISQDDADRTISAIDGRLDLLVIDHFGIGADWESQLRSHVDRIMVIDDLADRCHECDLLLDQNHEDPKRYQGLVPDGCMLLLGPRFLLLRPDFTQSLVRERTSIRRLFIFYGGTDPKGDTLKGIEATALSRLKFDEVLIVLGPAFPNAEIVRSAAASIPCSVLKQNVTNMAEVIANSDLALGAGGSNMWERSALGLPSIVTLSAENQREVSIALADKAAIRLLGTSEETTPEQIASELRKLYEVPDTLCAMSRAGISLTSLDGTTKVAAKLLEAIWV